MKKTIFGILAILVIAAAAIITTLAPEGKAPREREAPGIDYLAIREKVVLSPDEEEWLENAPEVRVRLGSWPPFMISKGQEASGISVDYLDVVAKVNGLKVTYIYPEDLSWPNTIDSIKNKYGVDLIPAIQTSAERKLYINFTEPYQTLPWVIVTRTDAPFVSGNQDLNGKTVTVQKDFILQKEIEYFYPELKLDVISGTDPTLGTLQAVATGKAFATINVLPVMAYYIARTGFSNLKIAAPADFFDMRLSMGIRKDWPQLVGIINKTFKAMSPKDISAINNSWLSIKYDYGISPEEVRFWVIAGVIIFLAATGLFLFLNKALKNQVRERTKELKKELAFRQKAQEALLKSEARFRKMVENAPLPIILTDSEGNIQYVNNKLIVLTGYSKDILSTMGDWWEHACPDKEQYEQVAAQWNRLVAEGLDTGPSSSFECEITCREGNVKAIEFMYTPAGENGIIMLLDVTKRNRDEKALKDSLHEKNVLLREIHHRVKNNLQIISSLLNLQENTTDDREQIEMLRECRNRVFSISMVHEELYRSANLAEIDLCAYLNKLITSLSRNISKQMDLSLNLAGNETQVTIEKAIPCGLIANELATNAIRHAFTGREKGTITAQVEKREGEIVFQFSDDGVGLPPDLDLMQAKTLGLTLVTSLIRQLKAEIEMDTENGTGFTITFEA